jgi:hypothetical protein
MTNSPDTETRICTECGQEYFEECGSVIHKGLDVWCAQKRIIAEKAQAAAAPPSPPVRPRPVWATLSEPGGDDHDPNLRDIFDGDSYICELATGEQLWAVFTGGAFIPCDDEGNEVATAGYSCPVPLDNVRRVMVRGHIAGFGPSCPRAGEAAKVGLVVVQPSLTDRVIAHVLARLPAIEARAKQLAERAHDAPILSAERDTRAAS